MRRTSDRCPDASDWKMALCSEFDRQHRRADLAGAAHEESSGADQALLVGERHGGSAFERRQRGLEPSCAGNRGHDPIGRPVRCLDDGAFPGSRRNPRPGEPRPSTRYRAPGRQWLQSARRSCAPARRARPHYAMRPRPRPDSARGAAARRSTVLEPIEPVAPRSVTDRIPSCIARHRRSVHRPTTPIAQSRRSRGRRARSRSSPPPRLRR